MVDVDHAVLALGKEALDRLLQAQAESQARQAAEAAMAGPLPSRACAEISAAKTSAFRPIARILTTPSPGLYSPGSGP